MNNSDSILEQARFNPDGLIPAIVQDRRTREVLTLAYMNAEALRLTLERGETHFWSRSRNELWHKGATSGNFQKVTGVRLDCDSDTVLVEVEPQGPACHTGAYSCFGVEPRLEATLSALQTLIAQRFKERPEGSYTTRLFESGIDKIVQKVGEEAVETVIAAKNTEHARIVEETSDLLYHLIVMLVAKGVTLEEIGQELDRRHRSAGEKQGGGRA
ncbi:MAG TPA: bifunctional phosphoribosyl-AMP cyclohydrolase/phosphoribosyl-ATP diphosphatase HisIE [Terriglobia bacterium]|nr:bifunctional phosphoribosyl-AMP cyclohydrolase/phosphoribosyl-ATP diphosphatase HisIE [Terriglobia bacterium]